jgi:hypothetical protein
MAYVEFSPYSTGQTPGPSTSTLRNSNGDMLWVKPGQTWHQANISYSLFLSIANTSMPSNPSGTTSARTRQQLDRTLLGGLLSSCGSGGEVFRFSFGLVAGAFLGCWIISEGLKIMLLIQLGWRRQLTLQLGRLRRTRKCTLRQIQSIDAQHDP